MKLSAILVSVNLVAALPVAAHAADEAVSDKAEWLKRNLAAMENAPKQEPHKVSLSDPGPRQKKKPVLRSFVPNRPLPRKSDIAQTVTLSAQTPVMAQMPAPLSGQVSLCSVQPQALPRPAAPRQEHPSAVHHARPPVPAAPQAIPGKIPTLPGQISQHQEAPPAIPVIIPEPHQVAVATHPAAPIPGPSEPQERILKQSGARLVQAPVLTPDQQAMLDELEALNRPGNSPVFQDLPGSQRSEAAPLPVSPYSISQSSASFETAQRPDIGPPPFPLNLLPEQALKDLVGRRNHARPNAPPAYFGSWHSQVASARNLPSAGFHSNIPRSNLPPAGFQSYARRSTGHFTRYAPAVSHVAHRVPAAMRQAAHRHAQAPVEQTQTASVPVLTYPAYQSSRVSMF